MMAARCGLPAADCILAHWCPVLAARKETAGWRAPCPACGKHRRLSVQVKGGWPVWANHCGCTRAEVAAKLAVLVPCVPGARRARPPVDRDALVLLVLSDLPPASLRLGLLELAGLTTADALDRLGVGSTHRSRVIAPLRSRGKLPGLVRNPRSPLTAHTPRGFTKIGKSPQVKRLLTGP
jgi:hypothetical protein